MTPLPTLANWERSSHSLHKAAMLLGAIRQLVCPREANYLELALRIEPNGLSTDRLPTGGIVLLDFTQAALVYTCPHGERHPAIMLAEHSQVSLLEALLGLMDDHGEAIALPLDLPEDVGTLGLLSEVGRVAIPHGADPDAR